MSIRLSDALEVCLQALEQGATLDDCLARYPALATELRPLLQSAQAARTLGLSTVPPNAVTRGRARVLAQAARLRSSGRTRLRPASTWRLVALPLAVLVFLILTGNTLIAVSADSLPGDTLYSVKRTVEGIRLQWTNDPLQRLEIEQEISARRVDEAGKLLEQGRVQQVEFEGLVSAQLPDGWLVAGIPVRVTAQTNLEGTIALGAYVEVRGQTQTDGSVQAERIKVESQSEDKSEDDSLDDEKPETTPKPSATRKPSEEKNDDDDSQKGGGKSESGSATKTPEPTRTDDDSGGGTDDDSDDHGDDDGDDDG